jgi:hypothetical protein
MFLPSNKTTFRTIFPLLYLLVGQSHAHDHYSAANPSGTLDAVIILHVGVQFLVWCILFPIGLIYGFTRYRSLGQCAVILIDPSTFSGHVCISIYKYERLPSFLIRDSNTLPGHRLPPDYRWLCTRA